MPSRRRLIFALTVLVVAAADRRRSLVVCPRWRTWARSAPARPLVGGPFELTDQDGKRVKSADFAGKYMLVVFGYTYCPDICPSELQVVSAALDELGPAAERIQPVFVTVDPSRDTPQVMKDYVANFHPGFVGLTGSEEDIAKVAKAYRVYYRKVEQTGPDDPLSHGPHHASLSDGTGRQLRNPFCLRYECCRPGRRIAQGGRQLTPRMTSQRPGCWAFTSLLGLIRVFARLGRKRGCN